MKSIINHGDIFANLALFFDCLLLGGLDGLLMHDLVVQASEESAQEWTNNVGWEVNDAGSWGIWEHGSVGLPLEKWLDESDGWVDASTGDSTGHADGKVEGESDTVAIDLKGLGTVVVLDHKDKGGEHEGAEGLSHDDLEHHASIIVATMGWAKLGSMVAGKDLVTCGFET